MDAMAVRIDVVSPETRPSDPVVISVTRLFVLISTPMSRAFGRYVTSVDALERTTQPYVLGPQLLQASRPSYRVELM